MAPVGLPGRGLNYIFDLYSAFSTRFTNNQRRFQFIKMWYTHHSIFNVVLLKAIKNPVLWMLPPRALLTVFKTGSAGVWNQSLIAFFQSHDALVHYTPHPQIEEGWAKSASIFNTAGIPNLSASLNIEGNALRKLEKTNGFPTDRNIDSNVCR
jgi:hypothetical protein